MKVYKYTTKNKKLKIEPKIYNNLEFIKILINFSLLLLSEKEHEEISIDELKFEKIYLINDKKNSFILCLFNNKYFIIKSPFRFLIRNKICKIYFNDKKEIKLTDIKILEYMIDIVEKYIIPKINDNNVHILKKLSNSIRKFKMEKEKDNVEYNLSDKYIEYIFIKLINFNFYYARYDYDKKNASDVHPLNHIDLGLENTIKLGLRDKIKPSDFINFNLNKEFFYIEKVTTYE